MSLAIAITAALIVSAVLYASRRKSQAHTSVPLPMDRLAAWELRLGEHKAQERFRQARVDMLFDERATVQAKVSPRLPK